MYKDSIDTGHTTDGVPALKDGGWDWFKDESGQTYERDGVPALKGQIESWD